MFTELCIGYQTITDSIQVLSHIHFRILLDYNAPPDIKPAWPSGLRRCNFPVVDWRGVGSNPAGDIYFHFEFSLPPRSEQVNGAVANEIKHVHSPEVIVVLDPRYDLSYKALYISTCSIALKGFTCSQSY